MPDIDLPPVPYKTPMLDKSGFLTSPWMGWFRQLFLRVGENSAPSNGSILSNPMTTVGDMIYGGSSGTATRLAGNSTTTKKFLTQTGSGSASAAPSFGTIAAADVPTLNQNTTGTAANVTGTVAIANGGTGQTTQQAAINALAGAQSSGKYLRSDGANTTLTTIQAADVPTLNQNTTGTASNVTGTVAIANGGSGQTTQQAAINALTGAQSSGKYLRSDGANATLASIQAADVPTLNQNTTGSADSFTGNLTGDVTSVGMATAIAAGVIVNADVNASAAIARTKIASGTNYRILANSSSGVMSENAALTAKNVVIADANGQLSGIAPGTSGNVLKSNGTDWTSGTAPAPTYTAPKVTSYTSGSGTHSNTGSPLYIRVKVIGGGGGGASSSTTTGVAGSSGSASTFGTSLISAGGGSGGTYAGSGGAGGTSSLGTGPLGTAIPGGGGGTPTINTGYAAGGIGGSSAHGGAGSGGDGNAGTAGVAGGANTGGGGGGGGGQVAVSNPGSGGGSGGYVEAIITSPSASYAYAVGAGGAGGSGGSTLHNGGAGGSGYVEVTEVYQ